MKKTFKQFFALLLSFSLLLSLLPGTSVEAKSKLRSAFLQATYQEAKGRVHLTWTKVSGAKQYIVYRSVNGGSHVKIATVKSSKRYFNNKTVKPGNSYNYKVKATATGKTSSFSNGAFVDIAGNEEPQYDRSKEEVINRLSALLAGQTDYTNKGCIALLNEAEELVKFWKTEGYIKDYTFTGEPLQYENNSASGSSIVITFLDGDTYTFAPVLNDNAVEDKTAKLIDDFINDIKLYDDIAHRNGIFTEEEFKVAVTVLSNKAEAAKKAGYLVSYEVKDNIILFTFLTGDTYTYAPKMSSKEEVLKQKKEVFIAEITDYDKKAHNVPSFGANERKQALAYVASLCETKKKEGLVSYYTVTETNLVIIFASGLGYYIYEPLVDFSGLIDDTMTLAEKITVLKKEIMDYDTKLHDTYKPFGGKECKQALTDVKAMCDKAKTAGVVKSYTDSRTRLAITFMDNTTYTYAPKLDLGLMAQVQVEVTLTMLREGQSVDTTKNVVEIALDSTGRLYKCYADFTFTDLETREVLNSNKLANTTANYTGDLLTHWLKYTPTSKTGESYHFAETPVGNFDTRFGTWKDYSTFVIRDTANYVIY